MQRYDQPSTQERVQVNNVKLSSNFPDIHPGKVFCKMIFLRIEDNINTHLSKQQFGLRKNRGVVDAIFIVRQIMEKAKEHQVSLHFVDVKAAFYIIWRGALWKMLRSIGVDLKITPLIEIMYDNVECAVVISGQLTEWFRVEIGVRQGCLLSPILFSLILEFVMADLKSLCKEFKLDTNYKLPVGNGV